MLTPWSKLPLKALKIINVFFYIILVSFYLYKLASFFILDIYLHSLLFHLLSCWPFLNVFTSWKVKFLSFLFFFLFIIAFSFLLLVINMKHWCNFWTCQIDHFTCNFSHCFINIPHQFFEFSWLNFAHH